MPWQVFALICVITVSIGNLLERVLMREEESDVVGYAIIFQYFLGAMALIFALAFHRFSFPLELVFSLRFMITALLWATWTVFTFRAAKTIGAGELTILSTVSTITTVTLGVFMLHETFIFKTGIGVLLIILSIVIVSTEKLSFSSKEGVFFALLASVIGGVAVVNDSIILKNYEAFSYTAIMSFMPGIILTILFPQRLKRIVTRKFVKVLPLMGMFCFFYTVQAIAFYLAFEYGATTSHLSPVVKSSVILTILLAALFLHERSHLARKLIAAGITLIGVLLIG
ncbi:MAG: EamA family transporter [Candidatus Pacebacteria bacterium]|nr:EamA family transporter [Candidatus Paceibacterota bacterium]